MKKIFLFFLTISTLKVVAQDHFIGVKVGANLTNVVSENFLPKTNHKVGVNAGLNYEYFFKKYFSIGTEINYNQRGFGYYFILTDNLGNLIQDEDYEMTFSYDYISVPIKTGFNIGNKFRGYGNIGVIPSWLVDAKSNRPAYKNFIKEETLYYTKQVSKFDFAGMVEIGGTYQFKNRFSLTASLAYQRSLTTITNSEYYQNSKIYHYGTTLTLGVKWPLKKSK